jgi:uncharacterized membrane protein YphA (DoxX/SURF4 family)
MAMTNTSQREVYSAWWALRLTFGLVPFLAGLDKFFNILTDWAQYQSPLLQQFLPISATSFMYVAGIIEMIVGLAILTRWTLPGSYAAMAWLVAIAVNLVTTGRYFDIAVRDVALAVAAYSLAVLTKAVAQPNSMHRVDPTREEAERVA